PPTAPRSRSPTQPTTRWSRARRRPPRRATRSPQPSKPSVPEHRRRTRAAEMKAVITGLAALGLGVTVAGCGTASSDASDDTKVPTTVEVERPTAAVDDIVEVDGVGFHLHCTGQGDATVLLIAGWGAGGDEAWSAVYPALAEQARVCTYDRPGTGTSDAPASDQTFETE